MTRSPVDDKLSFVVAQEQHGEHLDRLVQRWLRVSRRHARFLISQGQVAVADKTLRVLTRPVRAGQRITISPNQTPPRMSVPPPTEAHAPVRVLYADRSIVVVDKPAGLLTEADRFGSPSLQSVVPKILEQRGERGEVELVHRLDAGTSGVVVLARRRSALRRLNEVFREGEAQKTYLALACGLFTQAQTVDAPLGRLHGVKQGVIVEGKPARTLLESIAHTEALTLVRATPYTGRTHQIRVHLAHVGHPIAGDRLYGGCGYTEGTAPRPISRPMLHARRLRLIHPTTLQLVTFEADVPDDFYAVATAFSLAIPPGT